MQRQKRKNEKVGKVGKEREWLKERVGESEGDSVRKRDRGEGDEEGQL